ncbi:MAG: MBL fold metallo-hydrolase [bacterium]
MIALETRTWKVADWKSFPLASGATALWWLGQAGFAVRYGSRSFLIDPYLSDSLARKYAGTAYPHIRMMPPPVSAEQVSDADWVFCTHRHTDHMDPETLQVIAQNPRCRFVIPRAVMGHVVEKIGLDAGRVLGMNAGESAELATGVSVVALPSAHEELNVNEKGEHAFLGYRVSLDGMSVYHAGDCVPYGDHSRWLHQAGRIDVALLPVNGRDAARTTHGVLGNFTLDEALALGRTFSVPWTVVHHFGLFDFNTLDPALIARRLAETGEGARVVVPVVDHVYLFSRPPESACE